jgi:hypothetical protein
MVSYVHIFHTNVSGHLSYNFRYVEPGGSGWDGQLANNLAVSQLIKLGWVQY